MLERRKKGPMLRQTVTKRMIEKGTVAVLDFLEAKFPNGVGIRGDKKLFADDFGDRDYKHELACRALARAVLKKALRYQKQKKPKP